MKAFVPAALALLPSLALALPTSEPIFRCGNEFITIPPSLEDAHSRQANVAPAPFPFMKRVAANQTVIPAYFHVVSTKNKANSTSEAILTKQLDIMNKGYAATPFQFELKGVDYTTNDKWAAINVESDEGQINAMKDKLRKGSYSTLNVYFLSDMANGILGMCEFPTADITPSDSTSFAFDGCMVHGGSLPGAPEFPGKFDLGYTAVHEIGHWFGLYHVFQDGSCDHDGDKISDTPFQSSATSGCPTNKDSCPNSPGKDSVHNFMDYSDDKCYSEFTPGQIKRMTELWPEMREGK
jgi:hypothetical protein